MYRLCVLRKPVDGGTAFLVTWVRSEIALVGRTLVKLKDNGSGEIRHGWIVESAGATERPEEFLIARSQAHKKTRKASDV